VAQLPQGTRLTLMATQGNAQQVSVVDGEHTGKTGWIDAGRLRTKRDQRCWTWPAFAARHRRRGRAR